MQFTGFGSMMAVHCRDGPIRSAADAKQGNEKLKELFFFDLLAAGIWIARRGMINLSLAIGDAECDRLAAVVEDFLDARGSLIPRRT
jgi:glutamate-1-semialdehyde 2,1-aminomutase